GDLGGAAHHDPVLGAVVVHLQAETGAGLDHDTLDLEAVASADCVVPAPRAVHLAVGIGQGAAFGLEAGDDLLDVLGAAGGDDQHRIGRVDHDDVVQPHASHPATAGEDH